MINEKTKIFLLITGSVFLFLFCILPFLWMVVISLTNRPDFVLADVPFRFTISNYTDILINEDVPMLKYLANSIVISITAAAAATLIAAVSAYSITRFNFPGRIIIPVALLAFSMFPQISIVGYLFEMMTALGWINTYSALIFPYITLGLPLSLWIMMSYFSKLSAELDKAAMIDGASRARTLFSIILPLSLPGLFSSFMLVLIYSFNEFLFALMLTTDYTARTIPVGIALFEGIHGQLPWGHIMASSVIAVLPVLFLIAVFQKYIITGLTEGSLKG